MRIAKFRRIISEEYAVEIRPIIETLGNTLNGFLTDVSELMDGRLSIGDNVSSETREVTIKTDRNGQLSSEISLKTELTRVNSVFVTRVLNRSLSVALSSQPFVQFVLIRDRLVIESISNLPANSSLTLSLFIL
jgi:hypothetical protein